MKLFVTDLRNYLDFTATCSFIALLIHFLSTKDFNRCFHHQIPYGNLMCT